jgi:diaminohydroxyphosphoribosylaminopyrimidine deaminase/5-amino-6-(5-phosphoribosylamino)uracil reductase
LKLAMSLDGCVATATGDSQWITSEASRRLGHRLRSTHDGILVGAGTVRADDPRLDTRLVTGASPRPVVLDGTLGLFAEERRWAFIRPGAVVVCGANTSAVRRRRATGFGLQLVEVELEDAERSSQAKVPGAARFVSLDVLPEALRGLGFRSVLVEGGGAVLGSFVAAGLWHRMFCFVAPRLLGEGRRALAGFAPSTLAEAPIGKVLHREAVHGGGGDTWFVLARGG